MSDLNVYIEHVSELILFTRSQLNKTIFTGGHNLIYATDETLHFTTDRREPGLNAGGGIKSGRVRHYL